MQLNNTVFCKDNVTLMISDHSNGSETVSEALKRMGLFYEVVFFMSKGCIQNRTIVNKLNDFLCFVLGKKNRYTERLQEIKNLYFDEMILFNFGLDMDGVFSYLYEKNNNISISKYEEGILSYGSKRVETERSYVIRVLRHIIGKKDIVDCFANFYCFYPSLYKGDMKAVGVPVVTKNSKTADDLRNLFKLYNVEESYPEKYIFFTSVYDFEGGDPIGEYDIVCKIATLVGKDNLLIKVHPRDIRGVYEKNGFKVDKNSSIPWEAVQLSGDFSDKVFITATSGSVLAGSFMSEKPTRTFYVFKCCDISNNKTAQNTAKSIVDLLNNREMKKLLVGITIAESVEEIVQ